MRCVTCRLRLRTGQGECTMYQGLRCDVRFTPPWIAAFIWQAKLYSSTYKTHTLSHSSENTLLCICVIITVDNNNHNIYTENMIPGTWYFFLKVPHFSIKTFCFFHPTVWQAIRQPRPSPLSSKSSIRTLTHDSRLTTHESRERGGVDEHSLCRSTLLLWFVQSETGCDIFGACLSLARISAHSTLAYRWARHVPQQQQQWVCRRPQEDTTRQQWTTILLLDRIVSQLARRSRDQCIPQVLQQLGHCCCAVLYNKQPGRSAKSRSLGLLYCVCSLSFSWFFCRKSTIKI